MICVAASAGPRGAGRPRARDPRTRTANRRPAASCGHRAAAGRRRAPHRRRRRSPRCLPGWTAGTSSPTSPATPTACRTSSLGPAPASDAHVPVEAARDTDIAHGAGPSARRAARPTWPTRPARSHAAHRSRGAAAALLARTVEVGSAPAHGRSRPRREFLDRGSPRSRLHHADLDLGYSPGDWPVALSSTLDAGASVDRRGLSGARRERRGTAALTT